MKVIGWTDWDDPKYEGKEQPNLYSNEVCDAIITELRSKGYKFTGDYHQNGDYGVPILDDGTVCHYRQRSWGGIMAYAYPETIPEEAKEDGVCYVTWAWQPSPEPMVIPEPK